MIRQDSEYLPSLFGVDHFHGKGHKKGFIPEIPHIAGYIVHTAPAALNSKIIVFSGHGAWALNKDAYTKLPAKCSIKFYTMNMRTLSDGLGGEIDRGIVSGHKPDQEGGPFSSIPDMRLYPPAGLNIKEPDLANWQVVNLPGAVPNSSKNLQIKIKSKYGGALLFL